VEARDLRWIVRALGAADVEPVARLQALWAGYGEILRVRVLGDGATAPAAVVKHVRIPRGRDGEASRERKRRSYEVETTFYRAFAPRCDDDCRVPRLYAAREGDDGRILVLEDLDGAGFPRRSSREDRWSLAPCLDWLAAFHARFFGAALDGLWPVGSYWHLETRRDELAHVGDDALRAAAEDLDRALGDARHRTLLHGDAKLANYCFSPDGARVAAVDFQYAGAGPGVVDVAYLLYGAFDESTERALVDRYFVRLRERLRARGVDVATTDDVEREWRRLYPIAIADFARFLAGWAPEAFAADARTRERVLRIVAHGGT